MNKKIRYEVGDGVFGVDGPVGRCLAQTLVLFEFRQPGLWFDPRRKQWILQGKQWGQRLPDSLVEKAAELLCAEESILYPLEEARKKIEQAVWQSHNFWTKPSASAIERRKKFNKKFPVVSRKQKQQERQQKVA